MTSHLIISNPWTESPSDLSDKKEIQREENNALSAEEISSIAKKELREDENTRRECLEHLRNWIRQNPDIENCFTDDKFLLRFLRVKKFSLPMAEQMLLKYLNMRKRFKHMAYNMDYLDSNVNEIISNGYIFASPIRDDNGRRVIIYNLKKFDPHKYTSIDMAKVHVITYETINADEESQITGVNHVADLEGASTAYITIWSVTEFAIIIRWGEQSFPMRHKEMNLCNFPTALKYVYDFAQFNIKNQKLRDRFVIHHSFEDLHRKVPKKCLPLEMGGVMPTKNMIQLWKEELAAKRNLLLSYDSMNLLSDRGIIRQRKSPAQDDTGMGSLAGSFRKLEVD